jgi:hypothetical protein
MRQVVTIDQVELQCIELFRVALSEKTHDLRRRAIKNVKHEVVAENLSIMSERAEYDWMSSPRNAEMVTWIAKTSMGRHEAAHELAKTLQRFEEGQDTALIVAEQIGKMIWLSVHDGKFEGVYTDYGILFQVSEQARSLGFRGGKSLETLRKVWRTYSGVVHLGMALDFCEDNPPAETEHVLDLAERYRRILSENCPRGTDKAYVDPEEQISFSYKSVF